MDRLLEKLKRKAGGGGNKTGTDKARWTPEASQSPSPSLSTEPKSPVDEESSSWHSNGDQPREAFETFLRPPMAPSGDRHSNYRPHRRAPETPPSTSSLFPPGFSSHPYESSKKSYPLPTTSESTIYSPIRIARKELPKKEGVPNNEKLPRKELPTSRKLLFNKNIPKAPETSKVIVDAAPKADKEPKSEPDYSTRGISPDIEGSTHFVESPNLDSKPQDVTTQSPTDTVGNIAGKSRAERTAELLAKKYAHLVHQQELHAKKYMRIIQHREELESRGILWPTSPSTHEFFDDERETQIFEFPQFAPKPLILRNQREPQKEIPRPNKCVIPANGPTHDYEAAKLESWRQFYGKGEMMETLHSEIDEYLGTIMFNRLLKETGEAATRQSGLCRSEVTVRKYWDGVRGFLGSDIKSGTQ